MLKLGPTSDPILWNNMPVAQKFRQAVKKEAVVNSNFEANYQSGSSKII